MEEKEKRPENETSLHQPESKEESDFPSSSEKKESQSIVTGETTTWNFSQELEAHLQGEIEKPFTFDGPATGEKQEEAGVEAASAEEECKTAEASETSKEQDEAETAAEEEKKESEDLQTEEKSEPVVAEDEKGKEAEQEKQEEIPEIEKKETAAEQKEEKIEEPKEEAVAEQKEETDEPEQPDQTEQETEAKEKSEDLEKTVVLDIKDLEPKEETVAEQEEETNKPEQQAQTEQESEPTRETKAEEKREDLEKTVVLNIKDLREEQPAEQKQPSIQEERPQSSIRKKIIAAVAALFLVAAGWIGIASATGEGGQSVGQIFGIAPEQLIFQDGSKTFAFDLEDAGFDGKDPKTVDKQKLDAWIEEIRKQVERPARDANQERLGEPITPEQVGRKLDLEKLNQMLANFPALINKPQKLPIIEIQPKVTKADLEKVDQYLIGSYTTSLGNSSPNRLTNIRLASKAINGLILMPGEKFSFNKVVGERTPERGYKEAGVIIKGEFSEGIGGGICQVSSTLFNSVDEAGLKILQRVSHSAQVTYVPAGRDATVSWGGPDFKFKNNLDKPIAIKIFIKHGRITVNVYTVPGTKVNQRDVPEA